VIEGDPATSLDAEQVAAVGVPRANQYGRRLPPEARMVQAALDQLDMARADVVFIECGQPVCPTGWDLGEDAKFSSPACPKATTNRSSTRCRCFGSSRCDQQD
jgi:hypothetical protein